jgi:hypothetical protein
MSLSRLYFVSVSISSMSLQYRQYTLIRPLPLFLLSRLHFVFVAISSNVFTISSIHSNPSPLLLSRLHLRTRLDIHVNVFLQYRRYTLQFRSFPLSSPPFSLHFRRQFQLFISSPSSMYPRIRFHLLLILLGSLSVPLLFLFTFLNVVSYVPASPTPTYA